MIGWGRRPPPMDGSRDLLDAGDRVEHIATGRCYTLVTVHFVGLRTVYCAAGERVGTLALFLRDELRRAER